MKYFKHKFCSNLKAQRKQGRVKIEWRKREREKERERELRERDKNCKIKS